MVHDDRLRDRRRERVCRPRPAASAWGWASRPSPCRWCLGQGRAVATAAVGGQAGVDRRGEGVADRGLPGREQVRIGQRLDVNPTCVMSVFCRGAAPWAVSIGAGIPIASVGRGRWRCVVGEDDPVVAVKDGQHRRPSSRADAGDCTWNTVVVCLRPVQRPVVLVPDVADADRGAVAGQRVPVAPVEERALGHSRGRSPPPARPRPSPPQHRQLADVPPPNAARGAPGRRPGSRAPAAGRSPPAGRRCPSPTAVLGIAYSANAQASAASASGASSSSQANRPSGEEAEIHEPRRSVANRPASNGVEVSNQFWAPS